MPSNIQMLKPARRQRMRFLESSLTLLKITLMTSRATQTPEMELSTKRNGLNTTIMYP